MTLLPRGTLAASLLSSLVLLLLAGCSSTPSSPAAPGTHLFTRLPAAATGLVFENRLTSTEADNVFTYRNFYNGGGVGLGDVNGDGRPDIYLTANQLPNRLFLNRGDFRFEDVTEQAGVGGGHAWSTGIALVDVNGDGRLDLYVCNAGHAPGDDRANELFINQGPDADGVPRFEEQAAAYGLADTGYSTHAAFFDYDRDGDLDAYVLNNSPRPVSSFGLRNIRHVRDARGGDRLYRNDDGRFTDVSAEAGIYGSEIAFGLGVTVGDVNGDGWPDLYISNDFFERDYLYLNNQDGTFTDHLEDALHVLSLSSMGADVADVTNDGYPELYVTDMLPADDLRLKTTTTHESWASYQEMLRNGYYHQVTRNTLQLNLGDGTFSEVGQLAGVAATDWSWAPLLADFDGDGRKDLFVSNGVFQDVINQDFIQFFAGEIERMATTGERRLDYLALGAKMPSQPLANFAFRNDGDLAFTSVAAAWGLDEPSFSSGAAYGDLDDDGDLDLVVNNVNREAFVYRNEADTLAPHRYLQVALEGEGMNRFGLGAQVRVRHGGQVYALEQMPTRGFQSTVDHVLTFGLGALAAVDTLVVTWPDGRVQVQTGVATNQRLTLRQADAQPPGPPADRPVAPPLFTDVTDAVALPYVHRENAFVDFDRAYLQPRMLSTEGPRLAVADVNGDGRDDLYLGGAKESPGLLLVQQADGRFVPRSEAVFERDKNAEDVDAAFFDADADGDADLYVVSGGSGFTEEAPALRDRLYLNDGTGTFALAPDRLPGFYTSGGCVAVGDYDGDGDLDLFVGSRLVPGRYGYTPPSFLLQNDGAGRFTDVTATAAPALHTLGMVSDAIFADVDGDGRDDLVAVGEWMPVTVFHNAGDGTLTDRTEAAGLAQSGGLWNRLVADDLDGDGDLDLVAGNLGLNNQLRAAPDAPLTLYAHDFDRNGLAEPILARDAGGHPLPMVLRADLVRQLPMLAARLPRHTDYAGLSVEDLFTDEELEGAVVKHAYTLASSVFLNQGDGSFVQRPLPRLAQLAPAYGLLPDDFDGDGHRDLLLAGNLLGVKPDLGRMDASRGLFLRGDGVGGFTPVNAAASGIRLPGQTRDLVFVDIAGRGRLVVAARNNDASRIFQARSPAAAALR